MNQLPAEISELADKLDNVIHLTAVGPLTVPALCIVIGRYVAYEAGSSEKINQGLDIVWAMMRASAIDEAAKLYGPKE